jgi:tetratricopeptide (TPR) repeat protein
MPMINDDTTSLLDQLAAHRRTLAVYLRQLASLGANHAPPGVHNGIAEARAAIARLKAQLRAVDAAVDDDPQDVATPDEAITPVDAPTRGIRQTIEGGDHNIQAVDSTVRVNQFRDHVAGDKIGGDKVMGDKHVYHPSPPPRPAIDLDQAQQLLASMPLDTIPDPAALPTPHGMPLRRNPQFVGRAQDLTALAAALKTGGIAAITTGIGGVGKTQLAVEFAHRYGQYFAGGVFWLSFADPAGIAGEIAACGGAGALELYTDADGLAQAEQVAKVVAAWAHDLPRLLIFDNCDDAPGTTAEQQLADWLPKSGGCRVLVTSRRGQWRSSLGIMTHPLDVFSRAESIALLRGHRADLSDADAAAIAATLGDLPLALTLAGSYLETYRDEPFGQPAAYLANLRPQLLGHRSLQGKGAAPSLTNHEQNVHATFALSYQRLDPSDPTDTLAIAALARAACLAPGERFPRELLLATLGEDIDDEDVATQRADALRRLGALGLLEVAATGMLRIHRLIAAFAREAAADDAAQTAVEEALTNAGNRLVNGGLPARLQPLLAHLRHAMASANRRGDARAGALANAIGRAEKALINYAAARPLFERALAIYEQALGPAHPATAASLNNLAELFRAQGDYAAARPLFERALAVHEQALGPAHPATAASLNNLAELFRAQGDYVAARPLCERALAICEQALGPAHPDTAMSLNNLAALLESQGDPVMAQRYHERALAIREAALGPVHPDTAQSLQWIGRLLWQAGDRDGARTYLQRAVAIFTRALGAAHPTTQQCQQQLIALDAPPPSA